MATFASKRLQKELSKIYTSLPPGITLVSAPNLKEWHLDIRVLDPAHPIYYPHVYRLRFRFSERYPIEPPEVLFVTADPSAAPPDPPSGATSASDPPPSTELPTTIPLHPHIYSNGIICLDLLGREGWSPVQNVESVCMSLQSMLTGNYKAERPEGNDEVVRRSGGKVRDMHFLYDDPDV